MVPGNPARSKAFSITIIAISQVAAMSLWFSASAVLPALTVEFRLTAFTQSALTSAVQLGFVVGCVVSALLGLADRADPRRLFAASAGVGAVANAGLLVIEPSSPEALALRAITGICMAGVYPVGMKLASTWAKGDMGLMVGILVGALTLGSASPHLFNALGGVAWRVPLATASIAAIAAALAIGFAGVGPNRAPSPRIDPHAVTAQQCGRHRANAGTGEPRWDDRCGPEYAHRTDLPHRRRCRSRARCHRGLRPQG